MTLQRPDSPLGRPLVAGANVPRVDAFAKVTGAAEFAADVRVPGSLAGVIVRSTRPHARILGVDTRDARQQPGCRTIITGADLTGIFPRYGHIVADQPVLAIDRVRFYGEPVALVVADSEAAARSIARLVEIDYDDLPPLMTTEDALAPSSPRLHDVESYLADEAALGPALDGRTELCTDGAANVLHSAGLEWGGDVERTLEAAFAVVETRATFPMLFAAALEPYSATASFEHGVLDVISPCQHPFAVVKELSRMFGLPHSSIRVRAPYIGGAFGAKSYTKLEPMAAIGTWFTGRPVQVVLSMEESFHTARVDSSDVTVRSGFDEDGVLRARDIDIVLDTGAYAENSPLILQKAINRCFGPYRVPVLRVRGRAVYTTTVPAASLRGLGAIQTNVAGEMNIDQAAQQLGLDPFDIRRKNLVARGETLIPGHRAMDADLAANLTELEKRLDRPGEKWRGFGFGCGASDAGAYPSSTAQIRMAADGSALVLSGSTELGQGSRTVLTQVAAQELGLDLARVRIVQGDTDAAVWERSTGASRTTAIVGLAVYRACHDLLRRLREMAAEAAQVPEADVTTPGDGHISLPNQRMSYAEVIGRWFGLGGGEVVGVGVVRRADEYEEMPTFWELGMVGVEIAVDPEVGTVEVDHLVTVADVGYALNPSNVHGQELGGAVQGLGSALAEELVHSGGQLSNPNFVEYLVPRIMRAPARFSTVTVERGDGAGVYGSKGVGEGARIPIGNAMATAVARATGKWPDGLPLTPERVWRLIHDRP